MGFLFISYYPLKQGLKPAGEQATAIQEPTIYILLSIKTRIETRYYIAVYRLGLSLFISYYPLKQGLKRAVVNAINSSGAKFISYYPLKQGLKPIICECRKNGTDNLYPTIH